jgi:hypothetical protein
MVAAALQGGEVSDMHATFAATLGVGPGQVLGLHRIEAGPGGSPPAVLLGLYRGEEVTAALVADCADPPCPGQALDLGGADVAEPVAVLDLQGPPLTLNPAELPPMGTRALRASGAEGMPALLLELRRRLASGEERNTLVLCTLERAPRVLWEEITASRLPGGKGHRTFDLRFAAPRGGGTHLDLALVQTTLPGAGEQPAYPGPPRTRRYAYLDGAYQPAR